MIHTLKDGFTIDHAANPRFGDVSNTELKRAETVKCSHGYARCIGGEWGDLLFNGYSVEDGKTVLCDPAVNAFGDGDDWDEDDYVSLAQGIFEDSFASIGIETVEHS